MTQGDFDIWMHKVMAGEQLYFYSGAPEGQKKP
jgi:hypothetical protein